MTAGGVVLTRVDGRLVHGQVLIGWCPSLGVERIAVADAEVAADAWQRELLEGAAGGSPAIDIRDPAGAVAWYREASPTTMVLLRSLASLRDLVEAGAPVVEANLGGLHFRPGARRFLDYLFLTREDIEILKRLDEAGVRLAAQDLPGNPVTDVNRALAEGRLEFDHLRSGTA